MGNNNKTEELAWRLVAGLSVLLQLITLSFCGYIVNQLDRQRDEQAALSSRVVALETVRELHSAGNTP